MVEKRLYAKTPLQTLTGHTGFVQDTYNNLIDKTDSRVPTKREDYWIHTLKGPLW